MTSILLISFVIALITAIIGLIISIIYEFNIYRNLLGDMRKSLTFMFIVSVFVIIYLTLIAYFIFKKIEITNNLWIITSVIYLIIAIFWYFGTRGLFEKINNIQKEDAEKLKTVMENRKKST